MDKLAYGVDEAAEVIGVSRRMLYELIRQGKLPVIKVGTRTLVRRADLERMVAEWPVARAS